MPVNDTWDDWSTNPASNSPSGSSVPEIDDELRNIKAQVKANAATIIGDQTLGGVKTFTSIPVLPNANPTQPNQAVRKAYVDGVVQNNSMVYGVDSGNTDDYVISLTPALTAYATGQVFHFYANTGNTGSCTLNVNGLGAKAIKKYVAGGAIRDLDTGDILAGDICSVIYNGTQFILLSPVRKTIRIPHTWAIPGEIKVAAGDADFIVPFFVPSMSGQTVTLVQARGVINSGTSVTVKLQQNGQDLNDWTNMQVTTTATTFDREDVTLSGEARLALVVTAVSGTPKNLSFTVWLDYKV